MSRVEGVNTTPLGNPAGYVNQIIEEATARYPGKPLVLRLPDDLLEALWRDCGGPSEYYRHGDATVRLERDGIAIRVDEVAEAKAAAQKKLAKPIYLSGSTTPEPSLTREDCLARAFSELEKSSGEGPVKANSRAAVAEMYLRLADAVVRG